MATTQTTQPQAQEGSMPTRKHHLDGITHTATLDGREVRTTWTTCSWDAYDRSNEFIAAGAQFTRIFKDANGQRIVGYW